jgi:hypothetical protein
VQGLFDAHQRRDKGLGPALGPTAPAVASAMLAAIGFELMHCRSDWLLDASHEPDAALLRPLLEGIAAAAMEQQPASGSQVRSWLAARRDELRSGRLRARIGHVDLLALPRG